MSWGLPVGIGSRKESMVRFWGKPSVDSLKAGREGVVLVGTLIGELVAVDSREKVADLNLTDFFGDSDRVELDLVR